MRVAIDGARFEAVSILTSRVYLGKTLVYKTRKTIALPPFSDYRSVAKRRQAVRREFEKGRRLLPEVYLDCCEVLEPNSIVYEPGICMRRLGSGRRTLFDQLQNGNFRGQDLNDVLEAFDQLHGRSEATFARQSTMSMRKRFGLYVEESRALGVSLTCASLRAVDEFSRHYDCKKTSLRKAGRIRELHGDLHTGNAMRAAGKIAFIDVTDFPKPFGGGDIALDFCFLWCDILALSHPAALRGALPWRMAKHLAIDRATLRGLLALALLNRANVFAAEGKRRALAAHYYACFEATLEHAGEQP